MPYRLIEGALIDYLLRDKYAMILNST